MNVVRSNFSSALPRIEALLKESAFIAIDTEFTGLATNESDDRSLFDTIESRYAKLRRTAHNFTICQFGVSVFISDTEMKHYTAHSFNFYLFPKTFRHIYNPRFLIQCSNVEFLCEHSFDFNKWLYEGISFCNRQEETRLTTEVVSKDEKEDIVGFRRLFQLLVESKKPLLGHNMLYDLVYMFDSFYEPLPTSYQDFKTTLHSLFPVIIDTKNISRALRTKMDKYIDKTSLDELYASLSSEEYSKTVIFAPDVIHSPDSSRYGDTECFHEAAYDAYCVGYVFLKMAHLLAISNISHPRPIHFKQYLKAVEPFSNRINLVRGPINYINLSGPDPKERDNCIVKVKTVSGKKIDLNHLKEVIKYETEFKVSSKDSVLVAVPVSGWVTPIIDEIESHTSEYIVERHNIIKNPKRSSIKKAVPIIALVTCACIVLYKYNY